MFENRVLRRIFGPKREEGARRWRRPRNDALHNLNASTNIIRVIKSKIIRWVGHVEHMEEREMHTVFCMENLKGGDHSEDLGLDRRIILDWILGK
jgi:hypothetical protein